MQASQPNPSILWSLVHSFVPESLFRFRWNSGEARTRTKQMKRRRKLGERFLLHTALFFARTCNLHVKLTCTCCFLDTMYICTQQTNQHVPKCTTIEIIFCFVRKSWSVKRIYKQFSKKGCKLCCSDKLSTGLDLHV